MQAKLTDARTAEAETVSSLAIAQPPIVTEQEIIRSKHTDNFGNRWFLRAINWRLV